MKPLLPPTEFQENPYQADWYDRNYIFTPDGAAEHPKHHCKLTFDISLPFVRNFRTAVDVGCRLGEYSRFLHHHFEMTYCFDPNLWKGFASNVDLKKVVHFNCALGDEPGVIQMHGGTHRFVEGKMKTVPVFRLDDFELETVDYIKIDVEGFETKVLEGGIKTVERDRPVIVIEQNDVYLPDEGPLFAKKWLEERGYRHAATCPRGWDYIMVPV